MLFTSSCFFSEFVALFYGMDQMGSEAGLEQGHYNRVKIRRRFEATAGDSPYPAGVARSHVSYWRWYSQ
jgi:hypothetical protein